MKMTVTFQPDPTVTITVEHDEPDFNVTRLNTARVPHVMGVYRRLSDECVDRAMELGFVL